MTNPTAVALDDNAFLRPSTPTPKEDTLGRHKGGPFSSTLAPIFTKTARLAAKKKASQCSQSQSQEKQLNESSVSSSEVEIVSYKQIK